LIQADLFDWRAVEARFEGLDAVFFCLGVSSAGMSEEDYRRVSFDLPLGVAKVLERKSPQAVFCFISGAGTDDTGKGSTMWARVKGQAENALSACSLKAVYCFRPGYIQPMDGIVSKTPSYRTMYRFTTPLYPLLKHLPAFVTSTRQLGRAMVQAALTGAPKRVLESADINALAR
jgi:hypothetical protein